MVKIKDLMGELVKGEFKIEVKDDNVEDGVVEFVLKPTEGHKSEMLYLFKRQSERDLIYTNKIKKNTLNEDDLNRRDKFNKEVYAEQSRIMEAVLKNSYPDMIDDEIKAILSKYDNDLFEELCIAYKWIDRKVKEAQQKAVEEQLKKLSGEAEPQENQHQKNEQKS